MNGVSVFLVKVTVVGGEPVDVQVRVGVDPEVNKRGLLILGIAGGGMNSTLII